MSLPAVRTKRSVARLTTEDPVEREVGLQKLLSTRICDLQLEPQDVLAECLAQVGAELRAKKISFLPQYYLGDDDFWTTDRAISVNIPWYLANSVLWQMVNDHLFEYTRDEVLMYLRHETGHAVNYAFELWKRKDWTQTFGDFRRSYRDVYNANPWSHDYVRHLHRAGMYHYAQKHPDEDFAESFAVWLDPSSRWRRRYRDWQVALTKLEYVDRIIDLEGACRGTPDQPATWLADPLWGFEGNRRRVLRHQPCAGPGPGRVPQGSARHLPPALRTRTRVAGRPVGSAFHPATPAPADKQAGRLDRRFRPARDRKVPARTAGPVYLRAPGRA